MVIQPQLKQRTLHCKMARTKTITSTALVSKDRARRDFASSNRSRCSLQGNRYIKCPDDEGEFLIFTEVGKGMENAPLLGREDNQEAERGDDAAQTQGEDEESRLSRKEVIAVMSVVQKLEEELQSVKEALKAALGVMLRPPPPPHPQHDTLLEQSSRTKDIADTQRLATTTPTTVEE